MQKTVLCLILLLLFIGCDKKVQKKDTEETAKETSSIEVEKGGEIDPIANPDAIKGGTYKTWGSSFPKSLNMWLDYNSFSKQVTDLLFENLVTLHSTKNEPVGILAQSWTISDDIKTFTFKINPQATWSDGKPISAEDIQFYYDVMMNSKNMTSIFRVDLKRLERPIVIDEKTLQVTAKEMHWSNFWAASGLYAFPKHLWKDVDFNKQNFEFPVVSGPYKIKEVKKNRYITLERRNDWWGRIREYNQYKYNFDNVKYKFMEDRNKALEAFKKGVIDAYAIYTSSIWMMQTDFDAVKKGWVVKQRIFNQEPKSFQGFAINLRRPIFQDVRVRKALCLLVNRKLMNEKLMYNQYYLLNSYFPDLYPNNTNPDVPVREYDPDKSRKLLNEAGWNVGTDGLLRKNGNIFNVSFITYTEDHRHLNIYLEDLKKVGIQANIEQLSLSSVRKRIDNHDFDLFWQNWAASRLRDPEGMWHSSTADQIASNNRSGIKDPTIDSLIEIQKTELSLDKRNDLVRLIDKRLTEIIPYVLLWGADNNRILYWDRFGTPACTFDKFNREDVIVTYWWVDSKKDELLQNAMKNNLSFEPKTGDVHYKE